MQRLGIEVAEAVANVMGIDRQHGGTSTSVEGRTMTSLMTGVSKAVPLRTPPIKQRPVTV